MTRPHPSRPGGPLDKPQLPPFVYVPTTSEPDAAVRRVLLHQVQDGRTALYTYSAIDRLHRFYRPDASWLVCDVEALQRVHDQSPYDLLFLDVDPGLRDRDDEPDHGGAEPNGRDGSNGHRPTGFGRPGEVDA